MQGSEARAFIVGPTCVALAPAPVTLGPVSEFLSGALCLDVPRLSRGLDRMRRRYPGETELELARRCVSNAAWKAGAAGLALGLPDHPLLAIPAAVAEAVVLRRIRLMAVSQIALLLEDRMLEAGRDPVALLRPLARRGAADVALGALAASSSTKVKQLAVRHVLEFDLAYAFAAGCKLVGLESCGRLALTALPIIGAVAGAITDARAVRRELEAMLEEFEPIARLGCRVIRLPSPRLLHASPARRAAVELVAAGIRAGGILSAATRGPRTALGSFLAQARARARPAAHPEFVVAPA